MATREIGGPLFDLYERYVGEPRSRKDVYGYWTFIVGSLIGFVGVLVYLYEPTAAGSGTFMREVSITMAALGLPLGLLGIVLLLPVRRRGIQASIVGLLLALVGVAGFVGIYPRYWRGSVDYSVEVIGVYTAGVALVASVAALVPVVTGEKGLLVEDVDTTGDHPPIMLGEALHGALFAVYQVGTGQWTWRVIDQEAMAENAGSPVSRPDAEQAVDAVKQKIGEAGLLEITTSAFRLYENEDGWWQWLLMREDGSVVANSGGEFEARDGAEESVSLLKERGPDAPVIDIRGGAFDYSESDDGWRWRLVDEERQVLARDEATFETREDAEAATATVGDLVDDARVLKLDALGVELYEADGGWRWRIVDTADETVATSTDVYESRRATEAAVDTLLPRIESATVVEAGAPGYEVYESDGAWHWRLVDADDEVVARNHGEGGTRSAVEITADRMRSTAAEAEVVEIDAAAYEVYPEEDSWHWRLVTDDREVIADSTEGYDGHEAAQEAVEAVRRQALEADLIEFDHAAFQQYEHEGRWRWRLIDEDGNVMADSGEDFATRDEVGEAMSTLKEYAPDADILEIDTAAFELFQEGGQWGWRLINVGGKMVAEGASRYPSREDAREAMDFLVEHTPDAEVRSMERSVFQVYVDENTGEWHWQFVHPDGTILADGTETGATRDDLVTALPDVREAAGTADRYVVGELAVQLVGGDGERWYWRLVGRDREPVAESNLAYEHRENVEQAVETLKEYVPGATVFAIDRAAIRLMEADGGWRWELIDEDRTVLATAPEIFESRGAAEVAIDRVRRLAPDAGHIDFETAAFELYRDDDGWRWRLIDDRETVLAQGATSYDSRNDANNALREVKDIVGGASVLEIDDAAFELHRTDGGWIWRLVNENGTPLARSVEPHPTREKAREEMNVVKEHAPGGWTTVAE